MIKELGILASAMSLYTGGVRSPQYKSHEVVENDIAITYKYETNEVSSFEDLIEGRIYRFSLNGNGMTDFEFYNVINLIEFNCEFSNADGEFDNRDLSLNYKNITFVQGYGQLVFGYGLTNELTDFYADTFVNFYDAHNISLVFDFIFENEDLSSWAVGNISSSSFNEILNVERVYPDNIFGYVSEFIDEHLLNGIPNIDDVSYTIGGKSITMRSWLNTSICVVLAVLLIALLVWFIRYLFRLFSGLLH